MSNVHRKTLDQDMMYDLSDYMINTDQAYSSFTVSIWVGKREAAMFSVVVFILLQFGL